MRTLKIGFTLSLFFTISMAHCQKIVIPHIYTADPSAHVWDDDPNTLWIYSSHDVHNTNHYFTMSDYHVFSTTDMVNWIDYGRVLSLDDVDWAISNAWAIDAVFRNGKYYLVYCMIEEKTSMFRTALAISDVPQGPFTDIGFIKGVAHGQDPCLFVDDDNTPYLFWGSGKHGHAVQLADDLLSAVPGTKVELTEQLNEIFEGPWVHKYNDKYYCSYPALTGDKWPEEMCYAIADNPLGPYTFMGKYIAQFKNNSMTNHGSICEFKDEWYAFHHSSWLSGGKSSQRSINIDKLLYNDDGSIKPIIPDTNAMDMGIPKCTIFLEAEQANKQGGDYKGGYVDSIEEGFSGEGYVAGFEHAHDRVEVLVQVSHNMEANLKINLQAKNNAKANLLIGNYMKDGWNGTPINKTNGWEEINFGKIQLYAGDNRIRITCMKDAGLLVDYFVVEPIVKTTDR